MDIDDVKYDNLFEKILDNFLEFTQLDTLSEKEVEEIKHILKQFSKIKIFKKKEYIFREGSDIKQIYFLYSGTIMFKKSVNNSEDIVIDTIAAKSIIGTASLIESNRYYMDSIALEDCYGIVFYQDFIEHIYSNSNLTKFFMKFLINRKRKYYREIINITTLDARARLINFLYKNKTEEDKLGKNTYKVNINLKKYDLASLLRIKRPVLHKLIKNLVDEGIVIEKDKYYYIKDTNMN